MRFRVIKQSPGWWTIEDSETPGPAHYTAILTASVLKDRIGNWHITNPFPGFSSKRTAEEACALLNLTS